jgi:hypothetical protein
MFQSLPVTAAESQRCTPQEQATNAYTALEVWWQAQNSTGLSNEDAKKVQSALSSCLKTLKKVGAPPAEVEPSLVVYSAMLEAIHALKASGLPIPNPMSDNDAWSSNTQLNELRPSFQNGEIVALNADQDAHAFTVNVLERIEKAFVSTLVEKNLYYFYRGAYLERFRKHLTSKASSLEYENSTKAKHRNANSSASIEETKFELKCKSISRKTIDKAIAYFNLIKVYPKFLLVVYSKLEPVKILSFLNAKKEQAMEIVMEKHLDEASDLRIEFDLEKFKCSTD